MEYLPAGVTTQEVERRVEAGWGQGKIGTLPPRLREVARIGSMVQVWRPVGWVQLGPGGSLAPASARWTAPAPLPPYKRERAVSRGIVPPH